MQIVQQPQAQSLCSQDGEYMLNHPAVVWFIALVESWNARGWGEYLLFETVEGLRKHPWPFHGDFPEEDLQKLRQIRDELKVWPRFLEETGCWQLYLIKVWRIHTEKVNSSTIRHQMDYDNCARRTSGHP
jgi:hypothetical protein